MFNFSVIRCCLSESMMGLLSYLIENGQNNLNDTEMVDVMPNGIASIRFSKPVGSSKKVWQSARGKSMLNFKLEL